jgi:hypothetical protein
MQLPILLVPHQNYLKNQMAFSMPQVHLVVRICTGMLLVSSDYGYYTIIEAVFSFFIELALGLNAVSVKTPFP